MTRFNKEALLIDEADDGLQLGEFLFSIYKNDLKMMADMLYKATKYMNIEDTMIARGGQTKEEGKTRRSSLGQRKKVSANK